MKETVCHSGLESLTISGYYGIALSGVHEASLCAGRRCTVHNQSDHAMKSFPLYWRHDRGFFERTCIHGCGHPDPDQADYWDENDMNFMWVHGCDGCCG